ncbi:MAG: F0F1 ATP synthase subunit A [Propionibacteriales bacterium]|nr:F0F1 ATP synthase subunit A [Propionibacteriales bacterium]
MSAPQPLASTEIEVGHHKTWEPIEGFVLNVDTIWSTALAGLVVIGVGFWMRSKISNEVPSKVQIIWETIVEWVTRQVEDSLGKVHPFVVPLAITLFFFILIANWLELIPTQHWLVSPSADVNLTYALALLVIVGVHIYSIRQRGIKQYVKHYFEPFPVLFPLNLLEEIVKPFTLALRLFGNIFAGGIMIAMIGLMPIWVLWGPNVLWKLFDMAIGVIQAFIFALLTILYFGMAGTTHDEEHAEKEIAEEETAEEETAEEEPAETESVEEESADAEPVGAEPQPEAAH